MAAVTLQILGMRIAQLLGRKETDGWVYVRCARELGLLPTGRAGRGGGGAPMGDTPHAVLLLLAMAWGGGVRESLIQASETCALVFRDAVRNFVCAGGIVPWPFENQSETLDGRTFGDAVANLINLHRAGIPEEEWLLDRSVKPHRLHFGTMEGVSFAKFERRSPGPNEDGHIIIDEFNFASAPAPGSRIERTQSLAIDLLEDVAKFLGPLEFASGGGGLRISAPQMVDEDAENDGEIEIAAAGTEERRAAGRIH